MMQMTVKKEETATARITKQAILNNPITAVISQDRVELEFSDAAGERHRLYVAGYYNSYYPDGLTAGLWEEYVLKQVSGMTPAARKLLMELRDEIIERVERGEIPKPPEMNEKTIGLTIDVHENGTGE